MNTRALASIPVKPDFVAFTGVDRLDLLPGMRDLSRRYPIEWGILVKDEEAGNTLFPAGAIRAALLQADGLRFAAHVCGETARAIASGGESGFDPAGFTRIQVNHGFSGSSAAQIAHVRAYGERIGRRMVLQTLGAFPEDASVDWLYDVSFGTGKAPGAWPLLPESGGFCGYSGGLGPATIARAVAEIGAGAPYWLDMESGIRTGGWLDLDKCAAVCAALFG